MVLIGRNAISLDHTLSGACVPDQGQIALRDRAYHYIGDVPFLPIFDKPLSDWSHALKSVFDRIVATLAIVLLSPLLALLALGVKLSSPGPVFFVQKRYGFNNQELCLMSTPTLTSVDQCIEETINVATQILLPQFGLPPCTRPIIKMIKPLLVVRGSTGPVRA